MTTINVKLKSIILKFKSNVFNDVRYNLVHAHCMVTVYILKTTNDVYRYMYFQCCQLLFRGLKYMQKIILRFEVTRMNITSRRSATFRFDSFLFI